MASYEQKYKEALEKLQEVLAPTEDGCKISGLTRGCIENIFPELKESEDEKIRKNIINLVVKSAQNGGWALHKYEADEMLAWLFDKDKLAKGFLRSVATSIMNWLDANTAEGKMCLSNMECEDIDNAVRIADWGKIYRYMKKKLEKQDEQEVTDKVEPKPYGQREECLPCQFNYAGECKGFCSIKRNEQKSVNWNELTWEDINDLETIMNEVHSDFRNGIGEKNFGLEVLERFLYNKEDEQSTTDKVESKFKVGDWVVDNHGNVNQIASATDDGYGFTLYDGTYVSGCWKNYYHLWTINDAKDGDVLVTDFEEDNSIVLYKSRCTIDTINVHCCLDNKFICNNIGLFNSEDVKPATKKQRDLLFQTIKEKGYEWDAEKKVLKMIEQKTVDTAEPEFHEGDWVIYNNDICKIAKREEGCNILVTQFGVVKEPVNERNLSTAKLWTIKEAKDGDVLHSTGFHCDCIFIFNGLDKWKFGEPNEDWAVATGYCCLTLSADKMEFGMQGPDCVVVNTVKPATSIQRDLLFQKMKEFGYEWNAEKKELKKITEQNDSEDYGIDDPWNPQELLEETLGEMDSHQTDDGILEHEAAIDAVKASCEKNAAWSEDDEKNWYNTMYFLNTNRITEQDREDAIQWLKSVKDKASND